MDFRMFRRTQWCRAFRAAEWLHRQTERLYRWTSERFMSAYAESLMPRRRGEDR